VGVTSGRFLVLLGGLGLVACATSSAGTPAASPTPTTDLAAKYTELVKPPNDAGDHLRAASDDPAATIASLRPTAQAFLDSLVQLNKDLVAFQELVPAADKPDVAALRQTLSTDEADVRNMIATTTVAQFNQAFAKLSSDDTGQAATTVRSDLGLEAGNP
jgi:hypothetical protein